MSRHAGLTGIDAAYTTATVGTMLANGLFVLGNKTGYLSHLDYFVILDFFPALFFFLNGFTVTLTMRDSRISSRKLLAYMSKRGSVLILIGLLVIKIWPANLLIASGLFFLTAPFLARWNNTILQMISLLILTMSVWMINADVQTYPQFSGFELQGAGTKELVAFFFFNGYYSFFPWLAIFVIGMLFGRGDVRPRGLIPPSSIIGVVLIFIGMIVETYSSMIYSTDIDFRPLSYFPFSSKVFLPSFILIISGSSILFLNFLIYILRKATTDKKFDFLQVVASSKYSIYFFMVLLSWILIKTFNMVLFSNAFVLVLGNLFLITVSIYLVKVWKSKVSDKAPVEWMIKRISGSKKD